jgi:hypothetical protein
MWTGWLLCCYIVIEIVRLIINAKLLLLGHKILLFIAIVIIIDKIFIFCLGGDWQHLIVAKLPKLLLAASENLISYTTDTNEQHTKR